MSFNTVNFIINTMSYINALYDMQNNSAQNHVINQGAQNSLQGQNTNSFSPLNYTLQNTAQTLAYPLSSANQTIISTVEIEQRANYIKDLLNLPRGFEDFIKSIQNGSLNSENLDELKKLLSNGKINLNVLEEILLKNSKEATQKLMTTIMTVSKMGSNNVSQLKELMGMLSSAKASMDPAQTVKNILMLYLPWLPLSVRNELNLDFELGIKKKGQDGGSSSETLTVMIQTVNFGNVLITLEGDDEIYISIMAGENFPEAEVLGLLKKEKTNSKTNISVQTQKSAAKEGGFQDVKISASNFVSPKLIHQAYLLIKIIIDVDSKNLIINKEKEN